VPDLSERFLVFTRADRWPWGFSAAFSTEAEATAYADQLLVADETDRAVVMEVNGVDGVPLFVYRYGAKK